MDLTQKIIMLRKQHDMTQEELADRLKVSRQAVSRWETKTAMPDAANILALSRLFGVTTDYLLHDDYESDHDLPPVKAAQDGQLRQIMVYLVTLEIMLLIMQFICAFILQSLFFSALTFLPFVAIIGGFEYSWHKQGGNEQTSIFRRKFYKISAWLGLFFPIRLAAGFLSFLYPRPYNSLAAECVIFSLYLMCATLISLRLDKKA